jgi:hypothetical protein
MNTLKTKTVGMAVASAMLLLIAALYKPGPEKAGANTQTAQVKKRIVEQTQYWALPGQSEEVFLWRVHACNVGEKLGLPRGRVLRRQGISEELPDVMWEVEYPDADVRDRDLKSRDDSEFQNVRQHMDTLTRRFERSFWEVN